MEIIIAENSGLCYGVKRALRLAKRTRKHKPGKVYALGELIHNPRVIADLEKQGIETVEDPAAISKGTVFIRSHGVSRAVTDALKRRNIDIVDATCPIVRKIQKLVARLAKKNQEIIIVGSREHPESKGLLGYSRGRGRIIENEAQAKSLPHQKKRAVLAQSTQDPSLFGRVVVSLVEKTEALEVYNTICQSTQTRQKSTSELASRVDTLFIVGGRSSSNTRKLYEIAKRILPNTHFIESAREITPRLLKGSQRIGISGGASTPPEAIEETAAKIRDQFERQSQRENFIQWQS